MDITDKPMETIQQWQDWYRANAQVSKDSNKKLYVADQGPVNMPELNSFFDMDNNTYKQKATEYFSDTIAEFIDEMTAEELFNCFKEAVANYYQTNKKQIDNIKHLLDLVHGKHCQKNCEVK